MRIIRTEFFQLNIKQNIPASQFYFPDAANLRNVHLLGFKAYSEEDLIKSPDGFDLVDSVILGNTFLVLQDYTGKIIVNQLPLVELHNTTSIIGTGNPQNAFNENPFTGQKISWTKSYIMFDKANFVAKGLSYYFVVYYSDTLEVENKARKTGFLKSK